MADKTASKTSEELKQALNLDELSNIDFGPSWADNKNHSVRPKKFDKEDKAKHSRSERSRDRRPGGSKASKPNKKDGRSDRRAHFSGTREKQQRKSDIANFTPEVKVDLYPQDEAFDALTKRLRSSARTYQLFDLTQLLLEKPERYIVVLSPIDLKESTNDLLYYSVPGHLPFKTDYEAVNFVIKNHLENFFNTEEVEVEPPKGNFLTVNRCTITGELLGPPNYHRYQEFLQRHYTARIKGISFEQFTSKIESVQEKEEIIKWSESMKKATFYKVKEAQEGEPKSFETIEDARRFLLRYRKDKVVGNGKSVRFAGRDIARLPSSNIRRSIEYYVEQQKRFPLETANNIRGRLRRQKFAVYKKGAKGVSFVCAVRRKFRDSSTVFTDSINNLIEFIEKNPYLAASKLPKLFIGIDTEKQKPEKLKMTEADVKAASRAKAVAGVKTDNKDETKAEDVDTPLSCKLIQTSTEAAPKHDLSDDKKAKLHLLMLDLRWLITEGYVTEYGDGRLFAPPPMPGPKLKPPISEKIVKEEMKCNETEAALKSTTDDIETKNEIANGKATQNPADSQ